MVVVVVVQIIMKGLVPTILAQIIQLLVKNVGREDDIDQDLTEPQHFIPIIAKHGQSQLVIFTIHENIPRCVERMLLGNGLIMVHTGNALILLGQLWIPHAAMIRIVDESGRQTQWPRR
jgi:hypothetical protein